MKPELIHELEEVNEFASHLLLFLMLLFLTVFLIFKSTALFLVFLCMTSFSIYMLRKSKYKIRHIESSNTLIKQYSDGSSKRLTLTKDPLIELHTDFRYGKYRVLACNDQETLNLLDTYSYTKAKELITKLEDATLLKAKIGPHFFKLDSTTDEKSNDKIDAS
jgi:hypothetical protein